MEQNEFQTIHEIGFPELLKKLETYKGVDENVELSQMRGSASVVRIPGTSDLLLNSSVILTEGVHFDLTYTPFQYLGYKSAVAAVSKLLAMRGKPDMVYADLAVPNRISVQMTEQIFKGLNRAGKEGGYGVRAVDITASHQVLTLSVHATGSAAESDVTTQKGCKEGDLLCVTGDLGAAMAGLRILLREKKAWQESGKQRFDPDLTDYEYVVQRQLMPAARFDFLEALDQTRIQPSSMMGLDGGLLNELQILVEENEIGCEVFSPAIPISLDTRQVAEELKEDVDRYSFYGGEDYEILFTLRSEEEVEKLQQIFSDFSVIGEIRSKETGIRLNSGDGAVQDL